MKDHLVSFARLLPAPSTNSLFLAPAVECQVWSHSPVDVEDHMVPLEKSKPLGDGTLANFQILALSVGSISIVSWVEQ